MRKELIAGVCALFVLGFGFGCGDSSESEGSSSGSVAELVALERERNEILCSCDGDATYSESLCIEARAEYLGWDDCTLGLLDRPEFAEYTQCMIDVQKSLNECERDAECDVDSYCYEEHEEAFDACDDSLSQEVIDEAPECPTDYSFDCVGGGTVDEYVVCDVKEDCADGSDEAGCVF